MKKIIIAMMIIMIISIVGAATYKQGEDINLKVPCTNAGSYCSDSSICNLTTMYPNETILLNNQEMTNQIAFHNYTFNASDINIVGEYKNIMMCKDGAYNGTSTFTFDITLSGTEEPEGKSYILVGILIIIFGVSCVFLYLSDKMIEPGFKIFFLLAAFIFILGTVAIMSVIAFDSNLTSGIYNTVSYMLFALGMIVVVIFFYVMIRETIAALDLFREGKGYMDYNSNRGAY